MRKSILTLLVMIPCICFVKSTYAQSTNPSPYCNAAFDDQGGVPVDDHISRVTLGPFSNNSNAQYAFPHYVFYNNLAVPNFSRDSTYPLKLKFQVLGGCGYGVWIDFNHDGTFQSSEKMAGTAGVTGLALGDSTMVTTSVNIPSTAALGHARMRVRIVEDDYHHISSYSELVCNLSSSDTNTMDWGETEDYTINIVADTAATGISSAPLTTHQIGIYPNPTKDIIVLEMNSSIAEVNHLMLSNLVGQNMPIQLTRNTIDLSSLSKGLYFLSIELSTGETVCKRILKE